MAEEIELKFIVEDYNEVVKRLLNICKFVKTSYELTVMYDNKEKSLFKEDSRLRLRKIKKLKTGEESCELSYKKPKTREGIKIEEENEVSVSSFNETEEILSKLGFFQVSSYDRIRDTFEKEGCKVTLDSFSFGHLLEIEGDMDKIKKIAKDLNLDMKNNTSKSCDDIYADICKKKREKVCEHILFTKSSLYEAEKLRDILIK